MVNDVLQELFPTLDVENVPGELLFLMGTKIGWAGTSKAPTAGKRGGIQLFNPAASGQLVTISSVTISAASIGDITWGLVTTALGTDTALPRLRDTRTGVGQSSVSELRTSADTVALSAGILVTLSNVPFTISDGNSVAVLAPGTGLSFVGNVDQNMRISFNYRERIAEPSELSF